MNGLSQRISYRQPLEWPFYFRDELLPCPLTNVFNEVRAGGAERLNRLMVPADEVPPQVSEVAAR